MSSLSDAEVHARSEASAAARAAEIAAGADGESARERRPMPESPLERYRRAHHIATHLDTAHPEDVRWLGGYERTAEYRGQKQVHEAFGDEYLG